MKLCGFDVGLNQPFFLIAGPCVIEDESMTMSVAEQLKETTSSLGINFIFKSSFDKANRSSNNTFRGHGIEASDPKGCGRSVSSMVIAASPEWSSSRIVRCTFIALP